MPSNRRSRFGERRHSLDEIVEAMRLAGGNIPAAAAALRMTQEQLRTRMAQDPRVRALFPSQEAMEADGAPDFLPSADEQIAGRETPEPAPVVLPTRAAEVAIGDHQLGQSTAAQMEETLRMVGVREGTINKLRSFGGFEQITGRAIGHSLKMMHQMVVVSSVSLFDQAEHIRATYLDAEDATPEQKLQWYPVYTALMDLIGKGYDRTMKGTLALTSILKAQHDAARNQQQRTEQAEAAFTPRTKTGTDGG